MHADGLPYQTSGPPRLWPAFWQHDPTTERSAQAWIDSVRRFHDITRTSLIKLTGPAHYQVADRGVEGSWQGAPLGERTFTRRAVHRPADWANIPHGITRAEATVVEVASTLRQRLPPEVPLLVTVFTPATQALMLAEPATLVSHLSTSPDLVRAALEQLATHTGELIRLFAEAGVDGIFLVSKHHDPALIPIPIYNDVIAPSDRMTTTACRLFPANTLHMHGESAHESGWPQEGRWIIHPECVTSGSVRMSTRRHTHHPVLVALPYSAWEKGDLTPHLRVALDQLHQRGGLIGAPCAVPLHYSKRDIANWVNTVKECHDRLAGA